MSRYSDKLKDDRWKNLSKLVKERDGNKCRICNKGGTLHTHHRSYRGEPWEAALSDLITLCPECHLNYHKPKEIEYKPNQDLHMKNEITEEITSMSSLEIAKLTGKQHKNVMRDIRKQFEELEIDGLKFERNSKTRNNRDLETFELDKEQSLILASGYNVKLRQKIIHRWMELETQQPTQPETKLDWMKLAVQKEEQRLALELKNENSTKLIEKYEPIVATPQACLSSL